MKKIMILGASILQLPAIQKAKDMGLHVVAVDMNPDAVGFHVSGIEIEVISTIDIPAVLEAARRHHIDGIMTLASDMPMRTVAVVAKELGLVGISEETAIKATNKACMRQALHKQNVPIPEFFQVNHWDEFLDAINVLQDKGYRCIIKPADNSGSRGVTLLEDYETETIKAAYRHSKEFSRSGDILVEEYMEGPEVSVETMSVDGNCVVIQITDKLTTGAPYFVEMGHTQPSSLSDDICQQISQVAIAAVQAIGIKDGPSHTEIKITRDGPKIVELGARLGGDCITTHLVPLSTGVDMVECSIQIALGITPNLTTKYNKASAIRYLETECGKIKDICGIEEAENIWGIQQVSIVHGIGDQAAKIKSSTDRVGFVIAQMDSTEGAVAACMKAKDLIKVMVD